MIDDDTVAVLAFHARRDDAAAPSSDYRRAKWRCPIHPGMETSYLKKWVDTDTEARCQASVATDHGLSKFDR